MTLAAPRVHLAAPGMDLGDSEPRHPTPTEALRCARESENGLRAGTFAAADAERSLYGSYRGIHTSKVTLRRIMRGWKE